MEMALSIRRGLALGAILAALAVGWTGPAIGVEGRSNGKEAAAAPATSEPAPQPRVQVDARVELVSLIFRLADNPEYNRARVASYAADADKQFGKFRDHPAVQLARNLRSSRGVSFDACMNLAILLSDSSEPRLKVPLEPWPDFLDKRWTAESASNFVALTRQFVRESHFGEFVKAHQALYQTTETRLQELMKKAGHLEWFGQFFGQRPGADFTLVPALLNGGNCYGPHWRDSSGKEGLFCVLGVWATDDQGLPVFDQEVVKTVVHEFCHSYANPIIERHESELQAAGEKLFASVADQMRSQNYGSGHTVLCESLVRASVVRYLRSQGGPAAADREVQEQKRLGFQWMQGLSELLGQYETERTRYATLESFSPRLVTFFKDYSSRFAGEQAALEAKRPKVVSIAPASGTTNVNPAITIIQVVFDRPMRDGSWSMCGGGPNFPETTGKANYDARRTTWTVPVKLKPNWDYEFWLNAGQYQSFQSQEGVPLESVPVTFRTGPSAQP